ncbi:UNVERIFIED_CONTAM: hypothetical protein FKN15_021794 [Acipenser sinensis]
MVDTALGAAYGTAKSGTGIAAMSVMRPELIMKSIIPVVMAGIIAIYGLVVAVLIANSLAPGITLFKSFLQLGAGLSVGLSGLAAGFAIGIVGDAGVRGTAQQPRLFVGMILILIFAEVLALGAAYGTAKSGTGIAAMSVMRPELIMKSIIPVVMAGIIAIYGLVVAVLIANSLAPGITLFKSFLQLGAGLSVGLSGLAAGFAIGIVGDAGVRGTAQQPRLFVGMILILIFAEVLEEAEDPACIPIFWISKWVDYSNKYGLGYQLCDNSIGVLFNDLTRLIMYNDGDSLQYIERNDSESYLSVRSYPSALTKKITLLKYFRNFMSEHLLKTGVNITPRDGDELARLPFLRYWFRTKSAIVLHLSNGTVQINFFQDHTKVILCPLMTAVTFIDERREFHTYKLSLIEEYGCCKELASQLRYARTMVEKLLSAAARKNSAGTERT